MVAGVGIFEKGKYPASVYENGKATQTKAYKDWVNLCSMCGNESYRKRNPTYLNKTLHSNWVKFQDFAEWWHSNYQDGWVITTIGSDIIGPGTSWFVPKEVSLFLNPRSKPLVVTPKHVRISMMINQVKVEFGKYKTLPEAISIYAGLYHAEIKRFCREYPLTQACCDWLMGLEPNPGIRYVGV